MATAEQLATLARTRVRVPMLAPRFAVVVVGVADLRADASGQAELVDQVHHREALRILGERGAWHFVQAEDGYFGWISGWAVQVTPGGRGGRFVGRALAPVYAAPDEGSLIVAYLPAGTRLSREQYPPMEGRWLRLTLAHMGEPCYVSLDDAVSSDKLPHRQLVGSDLTATATVFLGTPYLWGGTSALGLDCSGLVQQVYRLNGVGLPRDADQQALAGREVEEPREGDLMFFGSPKVTHVALYTGDGEVIHAPQRGGVVERRALADLGREVVATRRYLANPNTPWFDSDDDEDPPTVIDSSRPTHDPA